MAKKKKVATRDTPQTIDVVKDTPVVETPRLTKFRPLGNRLVISRAGKEETKSGILLPPKAQEDRTQGSVLAIGPGLVDEQGIIKPIEGINIGDVVLFNKKAGEFIKTEGEEVLFVKSGEILAVVGYAG